MKRMLKVVLASAVALSLLAGCNQGEKEPDAQGIAGGVPTAEELAKPVATMDDYTVTLGQYSFFFRSMQSDFEYQAMMTGYTEENMAEFWAMDDYGKPMSDLLKEDALGSAKQFSILYKMAVDAGAQPSAERDAEADAQLDSLLATAEGDEAKFQSQYGLSSQQMRDMYHQFNLLNQYQDDLKASASVTEADIKASYEAQKDTYDQVTVRHVLITANAEMTEEEQAAAKTKADEILQKIQDGEEIGKLAAEFSEDPGSKDNNGEYTFGKGQMVAEFEDWAYAAKDGDTGVVQTSYGYHVMQMQGRIGLEDVKGQVEEDLRVEAAREKFAGVNALIESDKWTLSQDLLDSVTLDK